MTSAAPLTLPISLTALTGKNPCVPSKPRRKGRGECGICFSFSPSPLRGEGWGEDEVEFLVTFIKWNPANTGRRRGRGGIRAVMAPGPGEGVRRWERARGAAA